MVDVTAACAGMTPGTCRRTYFRGESGWLVFIMTRLCANAEIGVPREELHVSGSTPVRTAITALAAVPALPVIPVRTVITALPAIPASPPVIPAKAGILIRLWTF